MSRLCALVCATSLALMAVTACRTSDDDRLDKVDVDGTECVIVRDGFGRPRFTDCDWGDQ